MRIFTKPTTSVQADIALADCEEKAGEQTIGL